MEMITYCIDELPFKFYETSHSIEYDSNSYKIYIIGGKQNDFFYSDMSNRVYEYSIKTSGLKLVQSLDTDITGHRSIIVSEYLYIIGGRKNLSYEGDDYFSKIYKIDINTHSSLGSNFNLKFPRSNFGLGYDTNRIFLCFGLTNFNKYLNNIEILYLDRMTHQIVEIEEIIKLKDIGLIINSDGNTIYILGGEENNIKNSKIYYFDLNNYNLIQSIQSKEIVSGNFSSYGIKCDNISAALSNYTVNDDVPHIYMYSEMNKKWSCHSMEIY
jgi:hypothetical protein